ncbi:MAG: signal peptidase II [Bdellovibrionaceae bacterium]|nr:signal peptidase II [Pseudobdellovibrionaceae bacterium]
MTRKEWTLVFLPLIATWAVDRLTKLWALDIPGVLSYGWLHFSLHHNPGAMLGLFADLPPVLRIVSLSTGGAFLVCTYALIQYLLPIKSLTLRTGMSILLGGILGNVSDRIIWGHVVDFIILGPPNMASPAFNLADALQWVGYGLIVTAIIRDGELLWPENNARKVYWINPHFQLKYCFLLLGVGLGISLVTMVFSYTYLRVTILELVGNNPILLDKFLIPFALTFALVCIGFSVGLFAVGKIISHKIAGPIYAFERYIQEMTEAGKNPNELRNFKLRTKDEFKNLEQLAAHLRQTMVRLQPGFDHPEPEIIEPSEKT